MRPALWPALLLALPCCAAAEPPRPTPSPAATPQATRAPAKDAGLKNTLRWKTASELNNVGFDVYRGDAEDGPFQRMTPKPIPGAGTSDETHEYSWSDETIEAGKEYWYYVESISMSGVREKFTPTFKAPVKRLPPTPGASPRSPAP